MFWKKWFKKDPKKELQVLLGDYALPSFPAVIMEILSALRDDQVPLSEITRLIETDINLSVRILRLVNSAAFGLRHKVNSIQHAVTLLGRSRVESIVLGVGVKETLQKPQVRWFDYERYWLVSYQRATLARKLASLFLPVRESESFTASLLQDVGIPFLVNAKKETYQPVWEAYLRDPEAPLEVLEKKNLGTDHQEVGALLAQFWSFPEYLIKAIGAHHVEEDPEDPTWMITALMSYADPWARWEAMAAQVQRLWGMGPEEFKAILEEAFKAAEELYRALKA